MPKTTEQTIAELDKYLDLNLLAGKPGSQTVEALEAIACELRALRLMLREEIREAAWRLRSE